MSTPMMGLGCPAFTRATQPTGAIVDRFQRADNAELGVTEVGGAAWTVRRGPWEIFGETLRSPEDNLEGQSFVTVPTSTPNVQIIATIDPYTEGAIYLRVSDTLNWIRLLNARGGVGAQTTSLLLQRMQAGVTTLLTSVNVPGSPPPAELRVWAKGTTISFAVPTAGEHYGWSHHTTAFNQGAASHGVGRRSSTFVDALTGDTISHATIESVRLFPA